MITLKQFLIERHTAPVFVKGPLNVISQLVQKKFGLNFTNTGLYLTCLASQFIYTLSTVSDIDAQELIDAADSDLGDGTGSKGATLEHLFDIYNEKWLRLMDGSNRQIKFKLHIEKYHTIEAALQDVRGGQPVVAIASNSMTTYFDHPGVKQNSGVLPKQYIRHMSKTDVTFHALLLIGFDDEVLIFRETRSTYTDFNGMIKIKRSHIKNDTFALLATVVDDFEIKET